MRKKISYGFLAKSGWIGFFVPLLAGVFLWTGAYLNADVTVFRNTFSESILFRLLGFDFVLDKSLAYLFGFLCSLFIAVLLLNLNRQKNIIHVRTAFPFFFFIMLAGFDVYSMPFSVSHVSAVLLLLILYSFFSVWQDNFIVSAFNIGFLLTLNALLQPEMLVFLPLFLVGFARFNRFTLRSFLALLIGFLSVLWLVLVYAYLTDKMQFLQQYTQEILSCIVGGNFELPFWIYLSMISFCALFAIISIVSRMHHEKVIVSRMLEFVVVFFVVCMLLIVLLPADGRMMFLPSAIFASLLYTYYFSFYTRLFEQILFWLLLATGFGFYMFSVM